MSATFHLTIASVGETRFDGPATSATFPGSSGEFTVLAHHEPLITTLKQGVITVRLPAQAGKPDGQEEFPVKDGILESSNNRAIVLL